MALTDSVGGTDGAVTATGFNVDLDAWSADVGAEQTTSYRTFSSSWISKKNVGYGGSGTFEGVIQYGASDTQPVPSVTGGGINTSSFEGVTLTLTAHSGCTYTGTANITVVSIQRRASGETRGSFRFEFDGEVSITWAVA